MKNKIAMCLSAALLLTVSVSHAMRWGTEFTGVNWKMDTGDLDKDMQYRTSPTTGAKMDKISRMGKSASLFIEGRAKWHLGASAGFGTMPRMVYGTWSPSYSNFMDQGVMETKVNYVPVDLYLKYKPVDGKFSLFAGGGADFITADFEIKDKLDGSGNPQPGNHKGTFTQKKPVPHVQAGAEFFMFKWLSLNISAKYLFSAVFDKLEGNLTGYTGRQLLTMSQNVGGGENIGLSSASAPLAPGTRAFKYDFSGLRVNAALRIYFN